MKNKLSVSTWAQGIGLALMFAVNYSAFGQGIIYVAPNPQPYYSLFYPGTFDSDIDINGDGTPDFILRSNDGDYGVNNAVLIPFGDNQIVIGGSYSSSVADMNAGDTIGSSLNPIYQWSNAKALIGTQAELLGGGGQNAEDGNFVGEASGYMGFDLVDNGLNYYGWIHVAFPDLGLGSDLGIYGIVTDWAYESDPNTPITAGAVPEPSTLALVAAGAATLFSRRQVR